MARFVVGIREAGGPDVPLSHKEVEIGGPDPVERPVAGFAPELYRRGPAPGKVPYKRRTAPLARPGYSAIQRRDAPPAPLGGPWRACC